MAGTAPKPPETENVDGNVNVIEDMISRLKLDVEARDEQLVIKEEAAEFISEANDRIQNGAQALSYMTDYMTEEQIDVINSLELYHHDLEPSSERGNLNEVAQLALEIVRTAKNGQLTNEELHEKYQEQTDEEEALNYTKFNIKLRSLFSSQRLIRIEPEDAQNSRDHIIKINGFKAGKN